MSKLTGDILYYAVVLAVYFLMTYEGPPLRVVAWFAIHRASRKIALVAGSVNLYAENRYYQSIKEIHV